MGGGYVLVPPSVVPEGRYTWADPEIPIAPMPADLVARICDMAARARSDQGEIHTRMVGDGRIPKGERHEQLFRLVAAWRGKGLTPEEIRVLLELHAHNRCKPPFGDGRGERGELERMVQWAARTPLGRKGAIPLEFDFPKPLFDALSTIFRGQTSRVYEEIGLRWSTTLERLDRDTRDGTLWQWLTSRPRG